MQKKLQQISLRKVKEMIQRFAQLYPNEKTRAQVFDRKTIEAILHQPGCEGIRVYYAIDNEGKWQLIPVAIDKNNNDILLSAESSKHTKENAKGEKVSLLMQQEQSIAYAPSAPCPTMCGEKNLL